MRLRNPLAAVMAAASLLALAPASAFALKHPNLTGTCNVNINATPRLLEAGESVSVFGRLNCALHTNGAGHPVTLLERGFGARRFTVVASAMTEAGGYYDITLPAVENNTVFYVRSHGAASGRRTVRVLARVSASGWPADGSQLQTGVVNKVTFSGSVSPNDVGARVVLQRQNALSGNEWHRIDHGVVLPGGTFSITHTFVIPGDANIRVLVRSQGRNVPTPSQVMTYEISQAENPALTLNATADPIPYGQSVGLSGVVAGAPANTPVTLYARTARQSGLAPISEVKTDGAGAYSFPVQAPVASTFYQVRSAGHSSAVLYEGVRDVLTASVSQSTIPAGQALTFSGTVAPDHTGHVIYLEQQNRSGTGFHVVQVTPVGPGSAYTIKHTVYNAGTYVFRVHIPGGPENGGAMSIPFTITVTPAPAAALAPEASSNSTQPPQGEL